LSASQEFITIARVVRTQGRKGEVATELHTDFPERFAERRRLFALTADGVRRELQLEHHWPHKGRMILKFRGVDTISTAEELVGAEIQLPRSQRVPLQGQAAYIGDLVGCTVWDGARQIGQIVDVRFGAGDAPLLVVDDRGKEYLLPFAEEYLKRVDVDARRLDMSLPEGMLDLDAPLSEEEKRGH
jgi:16S rRNA processing protein RimM